MESAQVKALEAVVEQLKEDPTLVYGPELTFFKEFLFSWGAKVPPAPPKAAPKAAPEPEAKASPPAAAADSKAEAVEEDEEEDEEPAEPEEEDPERLPEDKAPFPEKSPNNELELTEAQEDAQNAAKQAAQDAIEDGDLGKAIDKMTEAIKMGNASAMMYAKRADLLLKQKRPCASIADCDAAIEINPDSAKAYRIRGKAYRKIADWEKAHKDLSLAQKLDFDDGTEDVFKFVDARWKKIAEKQNKQRLKQEAKDKKRKEKERKEREADMKKRKEQAQREYEEYDRKREEEAGYGG